MPKHRTDELDGTRLAIAVALAEGLPFYDMDTNWPGNNAVCQAVRERGAVVIRNLVGEVLIERAIGQGEDWAPHVHWSQGGPFIERERIKLTPADGPGYFGGERVDGPRWLALHPKLSMNEMGKTPLVAAMRALVAAKLGPEVELPDATD